MLDASRRQFLSRLAATGTIAAAPWSSPALHNLLQANESEKKNLVRGKAEHCVFVWLGGGAGHIDTWDPKRVGDPKAKVAGSYYKAIDTAVPGVQVCEHLPRCAERLDRFTLVRTVHHEVIDEHAQATNRVHTGRPTSGTETYPSIGSIVAHQRGVAGEGVPAYVLIGYPSATRGPGFLGARHGYIYLTDTNSGPSGLTPGPDLTQVRQMRREKLLSELRDTFRAQHPGETPIADYDATVAEMQRLAGPTFMNCFQLDREPDALRNRYGGEFGQRCLLTRRLIERGVRFVEVSHNLNFLNGTGWDVHNDGILEQHKLIAELDQALAALVDDLYEKKLLDKTLIVVGTEFGRPASFDGGGGRGHHSKSYSMVLAGGGLKHGRAVGVTDELGMKIVERPVSIPDLHATVHASLGINPSEHLYSGDRPVPITDNGVPIKELFV